VNIGGPASVQARRRGEAARGVGMAATRGIQGVVLGLALVAGCKDGRTVDEADAAAEQAKTECNLLFECGCEPGYVDEAECVQAREPQYEGLWAPAREAGLTWDGRCLGAALDALDELGCRPPEIGPGDGQDLDEDAACERPCLPYHGDVELGAPCSNVGGNVFSNCAQGLFCAESVCVDPCDLFANAIAEGEPCRDGFEVLGDCAEGLVCDAGASDTCIALPGPGQACPQGACAEGSWCQQIGTDAMCVELLPVGGECDDGRACASAYCQAGTCADVPAEGEPCTDLCADALFCDGGVCSRGAAAGESCETRICEFGLVCLSGVCEPGPGEGEPCAEGQCAIDFTCGPEGTCEPREAIVCSLGF
jgi:hypothetical protein